MSDPWSGAVVLWDVGGPLRDSSDSMGTALKEAVAAYGTMDGSGPSLTLDNRLMWQLYTIKGRKLPGFYGDYEAWISAASAIESEASRTGRSSDDVCRHVFLNRQPEREVEKLVRRHPMTREARIWIAKTAKDLFGADRRIIRMSRVSKGAAEALRLLRRKGCLMGIISAAPSERSVKDAIRMAERELSRAGIHTKNPLFEPSMVHHGSESKEHQILDCVIKAEKIMGREPDSVWYMGDINDDITEAARADRILKDRGKGIRIKVAMVRNGMGLPNMWEAAWKRAGLRPGRDYFEFRDALGAARLIAGTGSRAIRRSSR
jgi:phosphoglycolate phosphatase-like HAD superfamily hydrolase